MVQLNLYLFLFASDIFLFLSNNKFVFFATALQNQALVFDIVIGEPVDANGLIAENIFQDLAAIK